MQLKQFKFERLQVWDLAMDYGEKIQKVSTTKNYITCKARLIVRQTA